MPTESELREGAGFIRYEYLMLAEATRIWVDQGLSEASRATRLKSRMITDVSLLHARNLIDFIAPTASAKPKDVMAKHYNPSWKCSGESQLAGRSIADWRKRINKLMSHVTYERTTLISQLGSPRWPLETIHKDLVARLGEFLMTLPDSRREWFGSEIRAAYHR